MIDIEYWETHKNQIIKELNMPVFLRNIVDILTQLEDSIETKYREVNRRIIAGENTCIKLKQSTRRHTTSWTLPYTPLDDGTDNPFFKKLPTLNISDIAEFVHDTTGYGKAFTHIQPNYAKEAPEMELINACVIANATGTEMAKMMEINDVDGQSLKNTQQNFIRPQTLSEASDIIINHTEKLPIFEKYNLADYGVHASVDGQKFTTRFNTIKSRYAKKYFGLKKGVVVMTLNANMLHICLKVISANEHKHATGVLMFMVRKLDESYFGGRRKGQRGRGAAGKVPVFGLLKRGGKVYTKVIPDAKSRTLLPIIESKIYPDSIVYTDNFASYDVLDVSDFKHYRINHSIQFVDKKRPAKSHQWH